MNLSKYLSSRPKIQCIIIVAKLFDNFQAYPTPIILLLFFFIKEGTNAYPYHMQPFSCFTPNAMDLCDLSSHHVVDKEVLSLSCQYHLLPVPAKMGRGDGETLNVHTLKFRIHLTIHLNKNNHIPERKLGEITLLRLFVCPIKMSMIHKNRRHALNWQFPF